ncbi:hypothetical protein L1887_38598 [Cichorium endivia]|nr:hypothetical protein L1887_38598 [Cichorium endivia]
MATASDGRSTYESRGDGEKSRKRRFRPEINEEPQNVLHEPWQNNSFRVSDQGGKPASISFTSGISELKQMLKQMTFTRSEFQHLTALMHSRICVIQDIKEQLSDEDDVPTTRNIALLFTVCA